MVKAFILKEHGNAASLELSHGLVMPKLKDDEVLIGHKAIGINHYDIEAMRGDHGAKLPFVPGIEVVGVIEQVGRHANQRLDVGDRVAYCSLGTGGFAEKSIVNMRHVVKVPAYIEDDMAAAGLLKSVLSLVLIARVFWAYNDAKVLIFGAMGGVGHILAQLAKYHKCMVIAATQSGNYPQSVTGDTYDLMLSYEDPNFHKKIAEATGGHGANVAYDPIASKETLKLSERSLDMFGLYVPYGQISEDNPKINLKNIRQKSLYVTRPSFFHYCAQSFNMQVIASLAFDLMRSRVIRPQIQKVYKFHDIPKAYTALAERKLKMSNIITF